MNPDTSVESRPKRGHRLLRRLKESFRSDKPAGTNPVASDNDRQKPTEQKAEIITATQSVKSLNNAPDATKGATPVASQNSPHDWSLHAGYYGSIKAEPKDDSAGPSVQIPTDNIAKPSVKNLKQPQKTTYHSPYEDPFNVSFATTTKDNNSESQFNVISKDSHLVYNVKSLNESLHIAVAKRDALAVLSALGAGADIHSKVGERQETVLLTAAKSGAEGMVMFLLRVASNPAAVNKVTGKRIQPPDPDARDVDGWSVLDWAVVNGHSGVIAELLQVATDIEAPDSDDGWTLLHRAVFRNHTSIAELLLDKGANISAKDNKGWTPLHRAAFAGHLRTVILLLQRGADINAVDKSGQTPLHKSVVAGDERVVEELLKYNPDMEKKDLNGSTALDKAWKPTSYTKTQETYRKDENLIWEALSREAQRRRILEYTELAKGKKGKKSEKKKRKQQMAALALQIDLAAQSNASSSRNSAHKPPTPKKSTNMDQNPNGEETELYPTYTINTRGFRDTLEPSDPSYWN